MRIDTPFWRSVLLAGAALGTAAGCSPGVNSDAGVVDALAVVRADRGDASLVDATVDGSIAQDAAT